jgi:hypothetical protein
MAVQGQYSLGGATAELGCLQRVRQPVVEDVTFCSRHDLGYLCQPTKARTVEDSISIPREPCPLIFGTVRMAALGSRLVVHTSILNMSEL